MDDSRFKKRTIFLIAYLIFATAVYWMVNMSFKTNDKKILSVFSMWPRALTFDNYKVIFTDVSSGYINSMIYVVINTATSRCWCAAAGVCLFAPLFLWRANTCSSGC